MPELPEVETVCRGLAMRMVGKRFTRVEQRRPDLRFPLPLDFPARLKDRRVLAVRRRAKYLLIDLDDGHVILGHLGMSGRMLVSDSRPPALETHDHLIFELEDGACIRFNDARRFGMMDLVPLAELESHKLLRDLGPEPLGNDFNGPALAAALKGKKTPIKSAILDQKVVVGVGNIYASESLFRAGLSPKRLAATVQGDRAERLARAIRDVLVDAIAAGGSSLRDYVQADGELGYFQHQWKVYDREGQACPGCDCNFAKTGGVRRLTQGGRSTFYCSRRQR
ncbi:bifunctional DNA-formamidopyrimidine glycosylase/DNA-(apurinic or apyrimidinic site) lyase [Dongia soli]|uniref:Formamidopyrimidine-DNA glycosylase n=1 Tax=Dongia soli TaxID=600628 RepID=A0ABU5E7F1_9PROT|nr:bifunctional DNA-formamidopyrimidine glycosylase/DNA-(apurinic or apyrimidinic site) lyase [Dongia soli]MDY0881812.1 bifunctional DNA-formamidopyrimidine glycosylase/DNA-(apurinic or apyrimidinic site) lyase [Dongia soli]